MGGDLDSRPARSQLRWSARILFMAMIRYSRLALAGSRARRRVLAVSVVGLAAASMAGCGGGAKEDGRLVVRERLPALPVYVEGSVSFLRIVDPDGRVVVDGPVTDGREVRGRRPILDRQMAPGAYRIVSYQRPCQGNCDNLDRAVDRCERTVRLEARESRALDVVLAQRGGCRVAEAGANG